MRVHSLEVEVSNELRSRRRESALIYGGEIMRGLTSAATVQGFNARKVSGDSLTKGESWIERAGRSPSSESNERISNSMTMGIQRHQPNLEPAYYHSCLSQSWAVSRKAANSWWSCSSAGAGTAASASDQPCRGLRQSGRTTRALFSADTSTSSPIGHCASSAGSIGIRRVPEMETVFVCTAGRMHRAGSQRKPLSADLDSNRRHAQRQSRRIQNPAQQGAQMKRPRQIDFGILPASKDHGAALEDRSITGGKSYTSRISSKKIAKGTTNTKL